MATWGVEARIKYRAWNTSTNAGVAGDSANHTLTLRRAGTDSAFVGTVNDLGGGVYEAVVSGTLAETYELAMRGTSSTADVVLFFESPVRTVKAAPTLTEISDQIDADHGAGSYVDTGPGLTESVFSDALPANFKALSITATTGRIQVGTNHDKTGYALTTAEHDAIAVEVESHLLDEGDSQMLINAIVQAIGNENMDELALVAAVRSDLERTGGYLNTLVTRATETRLAKLDITGELANTDNADSFKADVSGLLTQTHFDAALPDNFGTLAIDTSGNVSTTGGGSGGATAQEVWEYATRTLTSIDLSGVEINALTPTQAAWLEAIYGKTALIGTGMATVSAPVTSEGGIDYLIVGDSYTGGRALEWQAPVGTFGDLTDWSAKFTASRIACGDETTLGPIDGTVNNAGLDGQSVTVQVSTDDTSVPAGTYRWAVYAEKDGEKLTLAHGQFAFRKSP